MPHSRRLSNINAALLAQIGSVVEIDLANAQLRVLLDDDLESDWIDWATVRAGETRIWSPPSVGEQVLVLSLDGDLLSALSVGAVFSDDAPPPGDSLRELILFKDGALIAYDPEAHHLEAILPDGGEITLTAPGHITINAQGGTTINGDVQVNGKLTASDDVIGGGKSLKSHKHTGVQAGGAQTGTPV